MVDTDLTVVFLLILGGGFTLLAGGSILLSRFEASFTSLALSLLRILDMRLTISCGTSNMQASLDIIHVFLKLLLDLKSGGKL